MSYGAIHRGSCSMKMLGYNVTGITLKLYDDVKPLEKAMLGVKTFDVARVSEKLNKS